MHVDHEEVEYVAAEEQDYERKSSRSTRRRSSYRRSSKSRP
jgi:hypothetical protein